MNLEELLKDGYMVHIGAHPKIGGFFAAVTKDVSIDNWDLIGHGFTVEEALKNGELIAANKKPITKYSPNDFVTSGTWRRKFSNDSNVVEYFDEDGNEVDLKIF